MDIERLFNDRKYLENEIIFFIRKKHIRSISKNKELVISHLKKAKHNFEFYKLNKKYSKFNDWLIVTLYYVLYHSALALITNKEFSSKNHYATILLLIKEYSLTKDEIKLLNDLSINKDDAEFYTQLKEDRHEASYTTNIKFNQEIINDYEDKVLDFINKTEELISL
ncbi:MAG: HEPN protein [archaeon GW2011_AR13]|nr:MAG: HEPN protein [archaeon GW2011_AR13]HIG94663.1 DNA-binding protein [Nanoarchaeota archaeon]HIH63459.1 DNA-binding protein [Nanoarchaeota archaeon]HIJ09389.1 DNA-binding protein [Nanoarchaeota archaeon]